VRSVGGWLEVETRPGQGTTLRIILPLALDERAAAAGAA
jgi:signal transduction histidine kinase